MGGPGSGRWQQGTKRRTVENCYKLPVRTVRDPLAAGPGRAGVLTWRNVSTDRAAATANYYTVTHGAGLGVRLIYRVRPAGGDWQPFNYVVPITTTRVYLGGRRYWFSCPDCGRRCGKLYLPFDGHKFACRDCHDLTYASCQEAHKWDGIYAELAAAAGVSPGALLRGMRGRYG